MIRPGQRTPIPHQLTPRSGTKLQAGTGNTMSQTRFDFLYPLCSIVLHILLGPNLYISRNLTSIINPNYILLYNTILMPSFMFLVYISGFGKAQQLSVTQKICFEKSIKQNNLPFRKSRWGEPRHHSWMQRGSRHAYNFTLSFVTKLADMEYHITVAITRCKAFWNISPLCFTDREAWSGPEHDNVRTAMQLK